MLPSRFPASTAARLAGDSPYAALILRRVQSTVRILEDINEVCRATGVKYLPVPEDTVNERGTYVMLLAEPTQDFTAVRAAFVAKWGEVQTFDHVTEIGDADDGEGGRFELFADDAKFEGFKVDGCMVIQFETGSEESIQIYPSANPEPATA